MILIETVVGQMYVGIFEIFLGRILIVLGTESPQTFFTQIADVRFY